MKSSRFIAMAASALLAVSTVTADAGRPAPPPTHGHFNPTAVWIIFGCASSIIFTAYVKHLKQHRELTQQEAMTCGLAYWFNAQNYRP
jgi:hypothetical protein